METVLRCVGVGIGAAKMPIRLDRKHAKLSIKLNTQVYCSVSRVGDDFRSAAN